MSEKEPYLKAAISPTRRGSLELSVHLLKLEEELLLSKLDTDTVNNRDILLPVINNRILLPSNQLLSNLQQNLPTRISYLFLPYQENPQAFLLKSPDSNIIDNNPAIVNAMISFLYRGIYVPPRPEITKDGKRILEALSLGYEVEFVTDRFSKVRWSQF
jgi:hypothetical protein